jgi:RHS repeat-associated protein
VTVVVTGRLLSGNGGGTPKQAELVSAQGYEAFGSLLPGRNYSSDSYDHGFNGMRKDDDMHGATGTSYDFGARLYDPRVGKWLSIDPNAQKYPGISPYNFSYNNPLIFNDPDGKDGKLTVIRNPEGGGTITLETTVNLYGYGASADMAQDLNESFAKLGNTATYTDPATGEVWKVTINANFVYNETLNAQYKTMNLPEHEFMEKPSFIAEGDNILQVDSRLTSAALGGHGNRGGVTNVIGGNSAKSLYGAFGVVMHESGHMLGFDERYTLGGYASLPGDIMAAHGAGEQIAPVHFGDLARFALFTTINGQVRNTQFVRAGVSLEADGYDPAAMSVEEMMTSGYDPAVSNVRREDQ